jgi:hypothetical protein
MTQQEAFELREAVSEIKSDGDNSDSVELMKDISDRAAAEEQRIQSFAEKGLFKELKLSAARYIYLRKV